MAASSVLSDFEEYGWILECQTKSKMEFADPGPKVIKLDQLLQVAASKQLPKDLVWEYTSLTEEMAARHRPVSGRQVIWIIPTLLKVPKPIHTSLPMKT